jgi:hypothetical protein
MGTPSTDAAPEGQVRGSWLLRSAIHYILGAAYLAGTEEVGRGTLSSTTVSDEDPVEPGSGSGVDG